MLLTGEGRGHTEGVNTQGQEHEAPSISITDRPGKVSAADRCRAQPERSPQQACGRRPRLVRACATQAQGTPLNMRPWEMGTAVGSQAGCRPAPRPLQWETNGGHGLWGGGRLTFGSWVDLRAARQSKEDEVSLAGEPKEEQVRVAEE